MDHINDESEKQDENVLNKTPKDHKGDNGAAVKELLAQLQEQQRLIAQQHEALQRKEHELSQVKNDPRSNNNTSYHGSPSHAPADPTAKFPYTDNHSGNRFMPGPNLKEVSRLQSELKAAQHKISAMNEELVQTRITKHTLDQALSQSGDDNVGLEDVSEHTLASLQTKFAQMSRPSAQRADTWPAPGYDESNGSSGEFRDPVVAPGPFIGTTGIWGPGKANPTQVPGIPLATSPDMQFSNQIRRTSVEPTEIYGSGNRAWNTNGNRAFSSAQTPPNPSDPRFLARRASYNPGAMPFTSGVDRLSPSAQFSTSPVGTPMAPPLMNDMLPPAGQNIWNPNMQVR